MTDFLEELINQSQKISFSSEKILVNMISMIIVNRTVEKYLFKNIKANKIVVPFLPLDNINRILSKIISFVLNAYSCDIKNGVITSNANSRIIGNAYC